MRFILFFVIFLLSLPASIFASKDTLDVNGITLLRFKDFSGTEEYITSNGKAKIQIDNFSITDEEHYVLRLTPRIPNPDGLVAGTAFLKIPFTGSEQGDYQFSTFFRFRITANNIYDGSGIVFVLHTDSRKDQAIGKSKSGMGFEGNAMRGFYAIKPSVGIKFNVQATFNDIDYNTVNTVLNGSLKPLYPPYGSPLAEGRLNNGIPWNVWVDYDGNYLTVRSGQSPDVRDSTLHTKRFIDIRRVLVADQDTTVSSPDVYIGFTADSGYFPAYHDILGWHFRPYYKPFKNYCGDPDDKPKGCDNDKIFTE